MIFAGKRIIDPPVLVEIFPPQPGVLHGVFGGASMCNPDHPVMAHRFCLRAPQAILHRLLTLGVFSQTGEVGMHAVLSLQLIVRLAELPLVRHAHWSR